MILSDYYEFEKIQDCKTRIDCKKSTNGYQPIEGKRNAKGELFLYLGCNSYTKGRAETKADFVLSKTKHISSLYTPRLGVPYAFGDMKGTNDAFLFILHNVKIINGILRRGAKLEIFIAENLKNYTTPLFNKLCNGEFDEEIRALRERAK